MPRGRPPTIPPDLDYLATLEAFTEACAAHGIPMKHRLTQLMRRDLGLSHRGLNRPARFQSTQPGAQPGKQPNTRPRGRRAEPLNVNDFYVGDLVVKEDA